MKIIILLAIFLSSISLLGQDYNFNSPLPITFKLSNISKNELKDSVYLRNKDTLQPKSINEITSKDQIGFISLSSGLMFTELSTPLYGSLDIGLKIRFLSDILYFNVGGNVYGFKKSGLAAYITPGLGFYFPKDNIFAFIGAGLYFNFPGNTCYNLALRLNYIVSKEVSIGFDSKLVKSGFNNNSYNDFFSVGLNFSFMLVE